MFALVVFAFLGGLAALIFVMAHLEASLEVAPVTAGAPAQQDLR